MRETTWSSDGSISKTSISSSLPFEFVTGIWEGRTVGHGVQVVRGACINSSMLRAPLRLNPVTSPSSSMSITSLPPDAFAKALICLAISLSSLRALFLSKYWFSVSLEKSFGSLWVMGCCAFPSQGHKQTFYLTF